MSFKKHVMFKVEHGNADPEAEKWRFRRRVLALAFLGALILLSIPVIKDRSPSINTKAQTRKFAEWILDIRSLAKLNNKAVKINFSQNSWQASSFKSGTQCQREILETNLNHFEFENISTQLLMVNAEAGSKQSVTEICFEPRMGIFVDGHELASKSLVVLNRPNVDITSNRDDRVHALTVWNNGDSLALE